MVFGQAVEFLIWIGLILLFGIIQMYMFPHIFNNFCPFKVMNLIIQGLTEVLFILKKSTSGEYKMVTIYLPYQSKISQEWVLSEEWDKLNSQLMVNFQETQMENQYFYQIKLNQICTPKMDLSLLIMIQILRWFHLLRFKLILHMQQNLPKSLESRSF